MRAEAVTPDSVTTIALTYTTVGTTNDHLFKLPFVSANVLDNNADIVAVIIL